MDYSWIIHLGAARLIAKNVTQRNFDHSMPRAIFPTTNSTVLVLQWYKVTDPQHGCSHHSECLTPSLSQWDLPPRMLPQGMSHTHS
jgi:hypothetical protein